MPWAASLPVALRALRVNGLRTVLAMLRLYLFAAGLPIPEEIERGLDYSQLVCQPPLQAAA